MLFLYIYFKFYIQKEIVINILKISKKSFLYPQMLKNIYQIPENLYIIGDTANINKKCISIVGMRDSTKNGEYITRKLAYNLAKKGYVIVSGLAKGIDRNAHIGALMANGRTIAVLGHGLDRIYPKENTILAKQILRKRGTLVTEYSIFDKIIPSNFVARNRIISGLSYATIVIEAKEKSGALITADFALEQGREVYAIPGNIGDECHAGCNQLIKEGANILIQV